MRGGIQLTPAVPTLQPLPAAPVSAQLRHVAATASPETSPAPLHLENGLQGALVSLSWPSTVGTGGGTSMLAAAQPMGCVPEVGEQLLESQFGLFPDESCCFSWGDFRGQSDLESPKSWGPGMGGRWGQGSVPSP